MTPVELSLADCQALWSLVGAFAIFGAIVWLQSGSGGPPRHG